MDRLPKIFRLLMKLFLPSGDYDFLAGDFEQLYFFQVEQKGKYYASLWLLLHIIKTAPRFILNNIFMGIAMIKNYIKTAIRNLAKRKLVSFINIVGLSVAIGLAVVSAIFVDFSYYRDTAHKNAENIFLLQHTVENNGSQQRWGTSPVTLGKALVNDFPQIKRMVRISRQNLRFKRGETILNDPVSFVDKEYLQMFDFELLYGKKDGALGESNIVLSETAADKYFGNVNPVGREITVIFSENEQKNYVVSGVLKKLPKDASFGHFCLLDFYQNPNFRNREDETWKLFISATFIELENPDQAGLITSNLHNYVEIQNQASPGWKIAEYFLEPLPEMARNAYKVSGDIVRTQVYPGQMFTMLFSGIFLLLLACFNFMNIAMGSASGRIKEIAIRKVIGSKKSNLIKQYLVENLILCFIALVIGFLLAKFLLVPWWNDLFGVFDFDVNIFENPRLLIYSGGMLALTAIVAGLYPAFYISSFQPVEIFRKKVRISGNNWLIKTLITLQFVLSFIFIIYGVVFVQNNNYLANLEWGYDQENKIVINLENGNQAQTFKSVLSAHPDVTGIAGASYPIGRSWARTNVNHLDKTYNSVYLGVGVEYLTAMGIKMVHGRDFLKGYESDSEESIIINNTFANKLKWDDPVGKTLTRKEKTYKIIGVTQDFHYWHFGHKIEPTVMFLVPEERYVSLVASIVPGKSINANYSFGKSWQQLFPDTPYNSFFQDQVFDEYLEAMRGVAELTAVMAAIAMLITCMGIFGIVQINVSKRVKEISIRKVLGASKVEVLKLVNRGFSSLLIISAILGIPAGYFLVKMLLDNMWGYHIPLSYFPFVLSFILIILSAATVLSMQYSRAIRLNPVDSLKEE